MIDDSRCGGGAQIKLYILQFHCLAESENIKMHQFCLWVCSDRAISGNLGQSLSLNFRAQTDGHRWLTRARAQLEIGIGAHKFSTTLTFLVQCVLQVRRRL